MKKSAGKIRVNVFLVETHNDGYWNKPTDKFSFNEQH